MTSPPPSLPAVAAVLEVDNRVAAVAENLEVIQPQPPPQGHHQLPGQAPNPLLIDVVLDNLFGYIDFEDLSVCRSVSKLWHQVSLPHWLRKGPRLQLTLDPHSKGHYHPRKHNNKKVTTMADFLRLVDNDFHSYGPYELAGLRQYKNFGVEGDLASGTHHHFLRLFLRTFGQSLRELTLSIRITDLETYRAVLFSTMTPNLAKLEASDVSFSQDVFRQLVGDFELVKTVEGEHTSLVSLEISGAGAGESISSLSVAGWTQLLKRYPNLQTIVYGKHREPAEVTRLLEAICSIRQLDWKILNLKRLEICCILSDNALTSLTRLLQDSRLALDTFRLSVGPLTSKQRIYEVLDSQAATLKNLIIDKDAPFMDFQPPKMDLLESLELVGYPFKTLVFLKSFPSLKSLSFTSTSLVPDKLHSILNATTTEKDLEEATTESLTKLHCNYSYAHRPEFFSFLDIRKLRRCMPRLRDLQLWLYNESLQMVCYCWPHLQRLCVVGDEVDDDGITGIIAPGLDRMVHIASLQDLRSLTMMHVDKSYVKGVGPTSITGTSLAEFLLLPKLEKLEVSLPSSEQVALDATLLQRMKEQIQSFKCHWARRLYEDDDEEDDDDGNASIRTLTSDSDG